MAQIAKKLHYNKNNCQMICSSRIKVYTLMKLKSNIQVRQNCIQIMLWWIEIMSNIRKN